MGGAHMLFPDLVIIDNVDVMGIVGFPPEANAPLLVDTNTMLTGSITTQCFEPIPRRETQVFDLDGGIDLGELIAAF